MEKLMLTLLMLLLVSLFIPSSQAVKCYSCTSFSGGSTVCNDPFEVGGSYCHDNMCVKQKTYINGLLTIHLHFRLFCSVYLSYEKKIAKKCDSPNKIKHIRP